MKSTANILILVSGTIILTPLAYMYLTHRLVAQTMSVLLVERPETDKITFSPHLPEYYIPICLVIGVIGIGIGVFLVLRSEKQNLVDPIN